VENSLITLLGGRFVRNLTLKDSTILRSELPARSTSNLTIDNCRFKDFEGDINLHSHDRGTFTNDYINITNSIFEFTENALDKNMYLGYAERVTFKNNIVKAKTRYRLQSLFTESIVVEGNVFDNIEFRVVNKLKKFSIKENEFKNTLESDLSVNTNFFNLQNNNYNIYNFVLLDFKDNMFYSENQSNWLRITNPEFANIENLIWKFSGNIFSGNLRESFQFSELDLQNFRILNEN